MAILGDRKRKRWRIGESLGFCSWAHLAILALSVTIWMITGQLFNLSEPQRPDMYNEIVLSLTWAYTFVWGEFQRFITFT